MFTDFKVLVKYNGDEWGWSTEMIVPGHEHEPIIFDYGSSPENALWQLGDRIRGWRFDFERDDWGMRVPEAYHFLKGLL